MHAKIDVLMCPRPQSLLPSSVFVYWGCYYCERPLCIDALEHTDTSRECYLDYSKRHLHRTVLLSVGAHEHCSVCRRSTSLEVYCRRGDTSSHVAHITIFGIPGWAQLIANGLNCGKHSTLVKTQACKCVAGQEEASHMLLYQES